MTCYADVEPETFFKLTDSKRPRIGFRTKSLCVPVIWFEVADVEPRANTDVIRLPVLDIVGSELLADIQEYLRLIEAGVKLSSPQGE